MTDALVFVKLEPDFVLRDPRMLALSYEAKGLYLCLWAMPMDKVPRTEELVWSNRKQMLHHIASLEPEPDLSKIERLISEIQAQGLIRISANSILIDGFKAKHPKLNWKSNRGRKPKQLEGNSAQVPTEGQVTAPDNFPVISETLPDNNPDIRGASARLLPCYSPSEKNRSDQRRKEQNRTEDGGNTHRELDAPSYPSPPVREAEQVSEIPEPCTTRTALFEETPKDKDNPETPQGMSRWKPLITDDTPRELTAQGEEFLATLHDYIRDGNQQAGSGKRLAAYNMLVDTVGIREGRATHIVTLDPLIATLLVCAGLIDYTKTPAALIITLLKNKADLKGTRIYSIVKSALNGRLANA